MENTVIVLGLFGSPRRGGNTDILLEEMLKGAEERGAQIERIIISELKFSPCLECHSCDETGECVIDDDMQRVYPKLLEADWIILASPIFFYGVTAWTKALIDRVQPLWVRKYQLKLSPGDPGGRRNGFFISVGATKGARLFEGAMLTMKYFFDAIGADFAGQLLFRGVEGKGDIRTHPTALQEAFEAGKALVNGSVQGER
ncbi:MAG: flavodoxin family protein [Syntrophobacterales bacterium]|nr:MAG: flavodoxin family protein [Syntrophobacterales bacterium]